MVIQSGGRCNRRRTKGGSPLMWLLQQCSLECEHDVNYPHCTQTGSLTPGTSDVVLWGWLGNEAAVLIFCSCLYAGEREPVIPAAVFYAPCVSSGTGNGCTTLRDTIWGSCLCSQCTGAV